MSEKMAMPGDELAASEEYIPGPGTYESGGKICAAVMGRPVFDEGEKTVRIIEVKRSAVLRRGDTVLGEVVSVSNTMASVSLSAAEGTPGHTLSGETGVIHISKASENYIDDVRNEYHPGDLVRARVAQASPSLQLSTREPGLGVLKARCVRCRAVLHSRSGKLYCADCDRYESRKLAGDFGTYTPVFEG